MTEQRVTVTITDGVADVRLNRPEKRNALDNAMFAGLITAGERLKAEPGVRAVVLSGEGPDFCAGLDFGAFQAMRDGERLSLQVDLPVVHDGPARATGQRAAYVWAELPVPVIAWNAPKSRPAQKSGPSPDSTTARTPGSDLSRSPAVIRPANIALSSALRFSGRFSRTSATPSVIVTVTRCSVIASPSSGS